LLTALGTPGFGRPPGRLRAGSAHADGRASSARVRPGAAHV